MGIKPIVKGVTIGAAVGTVCYMVSKSSPKKKRALKKRTECAVKAVGSMLEGFSSMM